MNKRILPVAVVVSAVAILLAIDPWRFAFASIDAGGHSLRMLLRGEGGPAVVFESGGSPAGGGPLESWDWVQPGVSWFTRTVSYDRAGIGMSAAGPTPRDGIQVARELHRALRNAGVQPPYILVGHSFGGPFIRIFAGLYPDEVAGLILVDPTTEEFVAWETTHDRERAERQGQEWEDIQKTLAQAHASKVPAGCRVCVITAMGPKVVPSFVSDKLKKQMAQLRPKWLEYHKAWVASVPGARHIVTEESGHGVPVEQPKLVIDTIREMVEELRSTSAARAWRQLPVNEPGASSTTPRP